MPRPGSKSRPLPYPTLPERPASARSRRHVPAKRKHIWQRRTGRVVLVSRKMRRLFTAGPILLIAFIGCATPEAKAPNPTHPLDEPRALAVIAQAYKDAGATTAEGRTIRLATG